MSHDLSLAELLATSRIEWHGVRIGSPDLGDDSRSIALSLWGEQVVLHPFEMFADDVKTGVGQETMNVRDTAG